jgi:hypothetical protein
VGNRIRRWKLNRCTKEDVSACVLANRRVRTWKDYVGRDPTEAMECTKYLWFIEFDLPAGWSAGRCRTITSATAQDPADAEVYRV